MKRMSIATLIALIVGLFASHNVYAATSYPKVFIADYDAVTQVTYAAVYDGDDHYTPIKFWLTDPSLTMYEDMLNTDQATYLLTNTLDLSVPTFDHNGYSFTWSYMDNTDIYTMSGVMQHNGYMDGYMSDNELNHLYIQSNGFITNGSFALLRKANPYASMHANGWIVQNGMLISYVVSNNEPSITHKLYVASFL